MIKSRISCLTPIRQKMRKKFDAERSMFRIFEDSYKLKIVKSIEKYIYINNTINYYEFACWVGI